MKLEQISTFEIAEIMLERNSDWVLVRVGPFGAIFEDPFGDFALSRKDMIRNLTQEPESEAEGIPGPAVRPALAV